MGRVVNIGLLEDEDLRPGDWVLIHVGFAMSKIDEEEANLALASLQMIAGGVFTDEVEALMTSPSAVNNADADGAASDRMPRWMKFVDEYHDPVNGAPSRRPHHRACWR